MSFWFNAPHCWIKKMGDTKDYKKYKVLFIYLYTVDTGMIMTISWNEWCFTERDTKNISFFVWRRGMGKLGYDLLAPRFQQPRKLNTKQKIMNSKKRESSFHKTKAWQFTHHIITVIKGSPLKTNNIMIIIVIKTQVLYISFLLNIHKSHSKIRYV